MNRLELPCGSGVHAAIAAANIAVRMPLPQAFPNACAQ
jgi:hypothetical protein